MKERFSMPNAQSCDTGSSMKYQGRNTLALANFEAVTRISPA